MVLLFHGFFLKQPFLQLDGLPLGERLLGFFTRMCGEAYMAVETLLHRDGGVDVGLEGFIQIILCDLF